MPHQIVFKNATVVDGTGGASFTADVAVDGDRISSIGSVTTSAVHEVDATGLVLAPGFIDVHTHDDFALLSDPQMSFKTLQGVTTVVTGNCGTSAVPFDQWAQKVSDAQPAVNVVGLIGHGSVREKVMGREDIGPPTIQHLQEMKVHIARALDSGAAGISTGLVYVPGAYSSHEEVVELIDVVAQRGGIYTSHIRNEANELIESVAEAISIGRETGIRVQISHLKAIGKENFAKISEAIAEIRKARDEGIDVMADQYPYSRGSTQLKQLVLRGAFDGPSPFGFVQGNDVLIGSAPHTPDWEGQTLESIAHSLGMDVPTAARHIYSIEKDGCIVVYENQSNDNINVVMQEDFVMVGSDGVPLGTRPHPRLHHTFPRILGRYSRQEKVLSLESAINKMTGLSAQRFGLAQRGTICEGNFADLVLFDAQSIIDTGTYENPATVPVGIIGTWVNGERVAIDGRSSSARSGQFLQAPH